MSDEVDVRDLARRVARLEAIQQIERLKYRYWRACDSKDPDAFRECFVRDGAEIDYGPLGGFEGREKLVELYSHLALRRDGDRWLYNDIHQGVHPDIELVDAGTAVGSWTFWFMRVNLVDGVIEQNSLEYRDRYVVEDGEWKIQRSQVIPLTGVTFPIPEGANVAPGPEVPR
ncbi:nuclear transport factor 2 family protein [Saccharopolyspora sp. NPDC002376]